MLKNEAKRAVKAKTEAKAEKMASLTSPPAAMPKVSVPMEASPTTTANSTVAAKRSPLAATSRSPVSPRSAVDQRNSSRVGLAPITLEKPSGDRITISAEKKIWSAAEVFALERQINALEVTLYQLSVVTQIFGRRYSNIWSSLLKYLVVVTQIFGHRTQVFLFQPCILTLGRKPSL